MPEVTTNSRPWRNRSRLSQLASGEAVSDTPAAEGASLSRETATSPFGSTEGLNLKQKLAEVRRRISYIQKRGHNERFNYSYVTAADIARAVGDALAELEVVVIPRLESISHENISPNQDYPDRLTRVVMTYTFMDVNSAEELTVKMPGEGRDPGDKGPYKAMTGALKYALLQSFLIATGDDPEDERADSGQQAAGNGNRGSDQVISTEQAGQIYELIEQTGTDVAKMLEYFKILEDRGDDDGRVWTRGSRAQAQTSHRRKRRYRSCLDLKACGKTRTTGVTGDGAGSAPAMRRSSWATRGG